jgi:prepilin-type N-terminal cleavage/methylation domain-containing protein
MRKAFSIVELMIVVAVLGILAAIVVPHFQSHATQAKEAAARSNLRTLRGAIEVYTAQHGGVPPGYLDNDPLASPSGEDFYRQLVTDGRYLRKMPENPFNAKDTIQVISNSGSFPAEATGTHGWIYQPAASTIKLDWSGVGTDGIRYYEY